MPGMLEREDIIDGLHELIARSRAAGIRGAEIKIIGGAALRLLYFDRPSTVDIDAFIEPHAEIEAVSLAIAEKRHWNADWLNDKARQFIPSWGQDVEWRLIHQDGHISVWVAPVDALLAMKLNALGGRAGRDASDVAKLLRLNGIETVEAAEELFERFYPGDAFSARTVAALERMYRIGLPGHPVTPPVPVL
ncbi:hypothetical protein B7R54_06975 [Subtercola boreus]|uniref:Uncharacterized protein n=1 Tax=Subtercola boreus TaxID=120213 RepID=A0A3E0VGF2_9MICO|nr:hypothetical protein [Subtercola boreus]RFA08992.1 hypothetical protein B7R54_06975 [Subtercola boreus]TQL54013.1 hypothetical protein FB464_1539 [Subtercola boreus]